MSKKQTRFYSAVAFASLLFGLGCLIPAENRQDRRAVCVEECATYGCYDDCAAVEVCDVYSDPWETWEECWYEEQCTQVCDTECVDVCERTDELPPAYDNSCASDWDCDLDDFCTARGVRAQRQDDPAPGFSGLCQSCETSYDCAEEGALCIQLNGDARTKEKVCARACTQDAQCPSNFECVQISQEAGAPSQCLPVAQAGSRTCDSTGGLECVRARDCDTGQSCVNNVCQSPPAAECDARTPCPSTEDVCRNFTCVPETSPECTDRQDCASNEVCVDGTCEAQTTACVFNNECDGDGKCVDGACAASCADGQGCGQNERCIEGLCEPVECRRSSDCDAGDICVDALCEQACSVDTECAPGFLCQSARYCAPDPDVTCRINSECGRDEICVQGECQTPCSCNQQCATGETCDLNTGSCKVPAQTISSCSDDCECPSGQFCVRGECALP